MTPLLELMSVLTTFALSTVTTPPLTEIVTSDPSTVFASVSLTTSLAMTLPGTTWYVKTLTSWSLFSGFNSFSTVPAGSFSNAALVGANTVNGPLPERVSARPAALTAATSVLKSALFAAFSTTVLSHVPQPAVAARLTSNAQKTVQIIPSDR